MKVIAIIPARSGSKGIPNKNIQPIGGKPLICWSIEAAIKSNCIDKIVVTSDGDDILEISSKYEEVTLLKRPEELAQDNTPTAPVVLHALETLGVTKDTFDFLILLQPTSPLRTATDIDDAFKTMNASDANALISVIAPEHHPLKCFKANENGFIEGLVNNEFPFMPRQELPKVFQPNGAIYIIGIEEFLSREAFFTDKTIPFEMSADKSTDVDTLQDIYNIEQILKP
jgi:CMP-N-acetylneuraminic acid synthetase